MKKILCITILFSSVYAHNQNVSKSIAENQDPKETTDFGKIKEKLENFGRHLLDIPKYIFGKFANRENAMEENLSTAPNNDETLMDGEENIRKNIGEGHKGNFRNYNQNNDEQGLLQTSSSNEKTKEIQSENSLASVTSNSWKATEDFFKKLKENKIKRPFATLNSYPLYKYQKTMNPDFNLYLEFFDARLAFPYCYEVINAIADQSACGASWASAAASVMSDRRCIASKGMLKMPVSAEDLMSCCAPCGFGCVAGLVDEAFNWWATHGIVTGGRYNSNSGCKPYSLPKCSHYISAGYTNCSKIDDLRTPECVEKCNNTNDLDYQSELTFGLTGVMWFNSVEDIQKEILSNGPVTANFDVYGDFLTYKTGIYRHITGPKLGVQTARIIGWGTDVQSGTSYWIMANSWNENWGEKGFFKIVRGKNECGVESEVFAALPKL